MKHLSILFFVCLTVVFGQQPNTHTYPTGFPPYQVRCIATQPGLDVITNKATATTSDVQVATTAFGSWDSLAVASTTSSREYGVLGLDSVTGVAYVAGRDPLGFSSGTSTTNLVDTLLTRIQSNGRTGGSIVRQVSPNWLSTDAYEVSMTLTTTSRTSKDLIQAISNDIFGQSTFAWTGTGTGATTTSWRLQMEVTRIITLTAPTNLYYTISVSPATTAASYGHSGLAFEFSDLLYGSAWATSSYLLLDYCDKFLTQAIKPLDVFFTVDNSGSMSNHQLAVANLGTVIEAQLASVGVSWRIALVTSSFYRDYYSSPGCSGQPCCFGTPGNCLSQGNNLCRYFSTDINVVKSWLTQSAGTPWIGAGGTCGSSSERCIYSASLMMSNSPTVGTRAVETFWPPTTTIPAPQGKFRSNVNVVLIVLGDADDQQFSSGPDGTGSSPSLARSTCNINGVTSGSDCGIQYYRSFFANIRAQVQNSLFVGGIICPTNSACGETQNIPRVTRGWLELPETGAVIGSLTDVASIQATVKAVFDKIVAASSPYILSKNNAVASSVQVLGAPSDFGAGCGVYVNAAATNEIPRSTVNGYDIRDNTVILYGNCRPVSDNKDLIVNYKYWETAICGDSIVQGSGTAGEQCDPGTTARVGCCENCRFLPPGTTCTVQGACSGLSNTCDASGTCVVASCPPPTNYCDVYTGCTGNGCQIANRTCLPQNCFKRFCDRTVDNPVLKNPDGTPLKGDCVFILTETGKVCDTTYCQQDSCGVCQGDNSTCLDCFGIPKGGNTRDVCGICRGDGSTCLGCDGIPYGKQLDACGVCGGDGLSCVDCSIGGQLGYDSCGVCNGNGFFCNTFDLIIGVPTSAPSATALTCASATTQVINSLVASGFTATSTDVFCETYTCLPVDDALGSCSTGSTYVIVKVKQSVYGSSASTMTSATQVAILNSSPEPLANGIATLTGTTPNLVGTTPWPLATYTPPTPVAYQFSLPISSTADVTAQQAIIEQQIALAYPGITPVVVTATITNGGTAVTYTVTWPIGFEIPTNIAFQAFIQNNVMEPLITAGLVPPTTPNPTVPTTGVVVTGTNAGTNAGTNSQTRTNVGTNTGTSSTTSSPNGGVVPTTSSDTSTVFEITIPQPTAPATIGSAQVTLQEQLAAQFPGSSFTVSPVTNDDGTVTFQVTFAAGTPTPTTSGFTDFVNDSLAPEWVNEGTVSSPTDIVVSQPSATTDSTALIASLVVLLL